MKKVLDHIAEILYKVGIFIAYAFAVSQFVLVGIFFIGSSIVGIILLIKALIHAVAG